MQSTLYISAKISSLDPDEVPNGLFKIHIYVLTELNVKYNWLFTLRFITSFQIIPQCLISIWNKIFLACWPLILNGVSKKHLNLVDRCEMLWKNAKRPIPLKLIKEWRHRQDKHMWKYLYLANCKELVCVN